MGESDGELGQFGSVGNGIVGAGRAGIVGIGGMDGRYCACADDTKANIATNITARRPKSIGVPRAIPHNHSMIALSENDESAYPPELEQQNVA